MTTDTKPEEFTDAEIRHAIEQWLEYGEASQGKAHHGYFSGIGWAARVLRFHLVELENVEVET